MNLPVPRRQLSRSAVLLVLAGALALLMLLSAASGAFFIALADLPRILFAPQVQDMVAHRVLMDVRLPRVVLAVVVGAGLAMAGASMQALFRNPLADPGLIGISSGAALGAVCAIVLGAGSFLFVAGSAFVGSLLASCAGWLLGRRIAGTSGLLLAGIAINAACGSAIGLFSFVANDAQLRSLTFWNLGSLAWGSWTVLLGLAPWTALLSWGLYRRWRAMNALLMGEREAWHLGFSLTRLRCGLIALVALLVGPLVAVTGVIGFVGLVVPHVLRLLLGGAIALTAADWLARVSIAPAELPVGIVTSLIGAPFFLVLILRSGRGG